MKTTQQKPSSLAPFLRFERINLIMLVISIMLFGFPYKDIDIHKAIIILYGLFSVVSIVMTILTIIRIDTTREGRRSKQIFYILLFLFLILSEVYFGMKHLQQTEHFIGFFPIICFFLLILIILAFILYIRISVR